MNIADFLMSQIGVLFPLPFPAILIEETSLASLLLDGIRVCKYFEDPEDHINVMSHDVAMERGGVTIVTSNSMRPFQTRTQPAVRPATGPRQCGWIVGAELVTWPTWMQDPAGTTLACTAGPSSAIEEEYMCSGKGKGMLHP